MKQTAKNTVITILTWQAKAILKKHKPMIVAVTGSVGKTSTKDAIYSAIKGSIRARKSQKSFNTTVGISLTILGLQNGRNNPLAWIKNIIDGFLQLFFSNDYPKVLILEAGVSEPGDMADLTKWLTPNIVVLTSLPAVPSHVEAFASPEAVLAEKMKLVEALTSEGVLVFNQDDTNIEKQLPSVRQKTVGFSRYLTSEFNTSGDQIMYADDVVTGTQFTVVHKDVQHTIQLPGTVGTQHVYACSAALAVANEIGITLEAAVAGLHELKTAPGRMKIVAGLKSSTLIDDTYNSSPVAVDAALQTLSEIKYAKRKIAVLGDMLELGKFSSTEHRKVGDKVAECADMLITVGVRARKIAEGALAAGMDEAFILQYDQADRAGKELQNILQSGDVVLVKASQDIRAEKIIEEVMAEPQFAEATLVRQGKGWR